MRYVLMSVFVMFTLLCYGLEVVQIGPQAEELSYANYNQVPFSFGGVSDGENRLFLYENDTWNPYLFFSNGLPITSTWKLNDDTMMVSMGAGTYSDGVWNFNLNTHTWTINDWFFLPNFVLQCPGNGCYYVGERDGLFKSTNGSDWTRITAIGSGDCNSFTSRDSSIVVNRDGFVYYSHNSGQTWQQAGMGNLKGFRYTSNGVLHGIMDVGSDSDGLWRSFDNGITWEVVFYSTGITCIGPDFNGYIPLGWNTAGVDDNYVSLLSPMDQLIPLSHPNLNSAVKQMEIFPLINTLSFYVLNSSGCYFITDFLPVANQDEVATPAFKLEVFPNPSNTSVMVKLSSEIVGKPSLEIYNLRGQLIRTIKSLSLNQANERCLQWDLCLQDGSSTASGIYLVILKDAGGKRLGISRLVVEK